MRDWNTEGEEEEEEEKEEKEEKDEIPPLTLLSSTPLLPSWMHMNGMREREKRNEYETFHLLLLPLLSNQQQLFPNLFFSPSLKVVYFKEGQSVRVMPMFPHKKVLSILAISVDDSKT